MFKIFSFLRKNLLLIKNESKIANSALKDYECIEWNKYLLYNKTQLHR